MSHHAALGYRKLVERVNRFPQGAPPSKLLYSILSLLFTEKEAALVSLLPIRPFTVTKAARIWKMTESKARNLLDELASRAVLLDLQYEGRSVYILPPPMAGFFEFSLMRVRNDIDQKLLSEFFFQYLNVEDAFIRDLFTGGKTQIGRVLVNEQALSGDNAVMVLDYERASEIIRTARHIGVSLCYCRHKMSHLNRVCEAPLDICMTLNDAAEPLTRHGHARAIDAAEGFDLLQEAWSRRLVQCADNVREGVNFICHCCGCCCEAMLAARRLAVPNLVYTTNFIPIVSTDECSGCGTCADLCPIGAMVLSPAGEIDAERGGKACVKEDICLGCGVCVRACPRSAIRLAARPRRVITPVNTAHRVVLMAIERGKLQNLIFDSHAQLSHRAMAAILGVILKLPPVKQLMASDQMKSRYLEHLLGGLGLADFSS